MRHTSVDDVTTELGRPYDSEDEFKQINWWIDGTERRIARRLGPLENLDLDTLRDVVVAAVARRVRNPEGKQNERIDDYSYGLHADSARSGLHITDEEWELLTPSPVYDVPFSGSVGYLRGW